MRGLAVRHLSRKNGKMRTEYALFSVVSGDRWKREDPKIWNFDWLRSWSGETGLEEKRVANYWILTAETGLEEKEVGLRPSFPVRRRPLLRIRVRDYEPTVIRSAVGNDRVPGIFSRAALAGSLRILGEIGAVSTEDRQPSRVKPWESGVTRNLEWAPDRKYLGVISTRIARRS